uniref:F-box domain-containing protein n=1 Tax=Chenopodium quinoa TaxID=63459 RepID=A0A803KPU2_CHEQI
MELQEDLLIEILARLPVTSLIGFTCVCKYWLSLIRSPEFATRHYTTRINSRKTEYDHDSLLTRFFPGLSFTIFSYENLSVKTVFKIRPAVPEPISHIRIGHCDILSNFFIYGPCNGIFLVTLWRVDTNDLVGETVLLLWNPATREVFKLPDTEGIKSTCAGVGFDDITNDYKVVIFDGTTNSSIVHLYSLAANSWREVDAGFNFGGHPPEISVSDPTPNGRMHSWIILKHTVRYDRSCSLLSFDMADEVFVETPLPGETSEFRRGFLQQSSNNKYPTLYNLDGERCIRGISIWVLKEYGPTGYWTKQHYISLPDGVSLGHDVVLWKNEGILYINDDDPDTMKWYPRDEVNLYNLRTQEKKSLHVPADYGYRSFIGYTESLVSIAKCVRQQPLLPCDEQPKHGLRGVLQQEDSSLGMSLIPRQNDMFSGVEQENASLEMSLIQQQMSDLSLELTLTQQQNDVDVPGGVHQEYYSLSLEMAVQQALPEGDEVLHEDDEDDNKSSTDSAYFSHHRETQDPHSYWVDYTEDEIKYYEKHGEEIRRLSKLPYCIREVKQPLSSKLCTF